MMPAQPEGKAMRQAVGEEIEQDQDEAGGDPGEEREQATHDGAQYRPTMLPSSSMSIRSAAGLLESPGMVRMSPLTR